MKLCRFDTNRLGLVREGRVYDVSYALEALPQERWPYSPGDAFVEHLDALAGTIAAARLPARSEAVGDVDLASPIASPSKVIAAPVNYRLHHVEAEADHEIRAGRPILTIGTAGLFLKATSSIVGSAHGIELQFPDRRTDHEVELAVVIGKRCKDVAPARALGVVAGYCVGLDITLRGSEDRSFRKSIDTYTVLGPWLTTSDEVPHPDKLDLELRVNGERRQAANTSQLIYDVRKLIAWASQWYTLYPGDVLLTGTPQGVGPIADGDRIDASIERLGSIQVAVRSGQTLANPKSVLR